MDVANDHVARFTARQKRQPNREVAEARFLKAYGELEEIIGSSGVIHGLLRADSPHETLAIDREKMRRYAGDLRMYLAQERSTKPAMAAEPLRRLMRAHSDYHRAIRGGEITI